MMMVKTTFRPGGGFSQHCNICHSQIIDKDGLGLLLHLLLQMSGNEGTIIIIIPLPY